MRKPLPIFKKVLLVESHDSLRRLIGGFLAKEFEVVSAKNGLEAMIWLSKGYLPDVIVAGTQIADLGGIAFFHNLRCSGLFGSIPVVAIGNKENEGEEEVFRQLGSTDYFRKPFNPIQLQNRLIQIIG